MTRRLSCCARAPRHRSRSTPFLALTARTPKRRTLSGHSVLRQTGPGQQSTHGPRVAAEAEAAAQGQRALRTSPRARISPRRSARHSEVAPLVCGNGGRTRDRSAASPSRRRSKRTAAHARRYSRGVMSSLQRPRGRKGRSQAGIAQPRCSPTPQHSACGGAELVSRRRASGGIRASGHKPRCLSAAASRTAQPSAAGRSIHSICMAALALQRVMAGPLSGATEAAKYRQPS
jgi:hypothetical protein